MTFGRMGAWAVAAFVLFLAFKVVGWWKNPWVPGAAVEVKPPSASATYIPGCADKPDCAPKP